MEGRGRERRRMSKRETARFARGRKERMDFIQRAPRYFIMHADTKRTCDGRSCAHRGGMRCKNTVGEKQYAPFRSCRSARSRFAGTNTLWGSHAYNTEKTKRVNMKKKKKTRREDDEGERKGERKREKLQGCAKNFAAVRLRAAPFYLDFLLTHEQISIVEKCRMEYFRSVAATRPLAEKAIHYYSRLRRTHQPLSPILFRGNKNTASVYHRYIRKY